jgi:arylsulfatase A-like enzyme
MPEATAHHPNIVFVLTDDQGPWALGCAGNHELQTPNLDRIAAGGMRFDNFFCASPVCSPARATILTGRMPSQHGVHDWIRRGSMDSSSTPGFGGNDDCGIEYLAGITAYTEHLAAAGYVCGLSGKWHLGDSLSAQKGFSFWNLFPYGGGDYVNPWMIRDGQVVREEGYLTDIITDGALRFLDSREHDDAPFYLGVHYTAPHSPWDAGQHPADLVSLYDDCAFETCPEVPGGHPWQIASAPRGTGERRRELLAGYFAAISGVDRSVGRIMERLDSMGELENTLFIFTSDNGMNMGHHGIWGKGNGTFPQNMYDTSVKVPMIISRPGSVPAGVVDTSLRSHYDLFPTLLEYAGVLQQADDEQAAARPGTSFAHLLGGRLEQADAETDESSVVVYDEYGPVRMIRTREWKYIHRYPYGPHELYHIGKDPDETNNLIAEGATHPRAAALRSELDRWFVRYVDPARDGTKEPVTGKGQLDLAGIPGNGRRAFAGDWWYMDEDGTPRPDRSLTYGRVADGT